MGAKICEFSSEIPRTLRKGSLSAGTSSPAGSVRLEFSNDCFYCGFSVVFLFSGMRVSFSRFRPAFCETTLLEGAAKKKKKKKKKKLTKFCQKIPNLPRALNHKYRRLGMEMSSEPSSANVASAKRLSGKRALALFIQTFFLTVLSFLRQLGDRSLSHILNHLLCIDGDRSESRIIRERSPRLSN